MARRPHPTSPSAALAALLCGALLAPATRCQNGADEALAQARVRLTRALELTARVRSCEFAASWGRHKDAGGQKDTLDDMLRFLGRTGGTAKGRWDDEMLHVALGDDHVDELLFAGRQMLARDDDHAWCLRQGHFADGNRIDFVPDPVRLCEALAAMELHVVRREPAAIDDRPVEAVTVSLAPEQLGELLWNGLAPRPPDPSQWGAFGRPVRAPAAPPRDPIDVVCYFDPGTGMLVRIHFRTWPRQPNSGGNAQVLVVGGGAGGAITVHSGGAGDDDAEDEDAGHGTDEGADGAKAPPQAPQPAFVDNLPDRRSKKRMAFDYRVDLSQHGTATLQLDDAAKKLLHR